MPRTPVIPIKLTDIREKDEYIAEAERIADEYKVTKRETKMKNRHAKVITEPVMSMRERILRMSLFPNTYNKPYTG